MSQQAPASWYPDPFARHELRYWDGSQWTEHVASRGRQETDPPIAGAPVPGVLRTSKKVQREVRRSGVASRVQIGGGTIFTEPVLFVSQKAKLIELNAEYAVYNQHGQQIGAVREVGQSIMKMALGASADLNLTHRLQIVDMEGRVLLALTYTPAFRSKTIVRDANGAEVGQIVQKTLGIIRSLRFTFESRGKTLGSINVADLASWDFSIQDAVGDELALITKTWAGLIKETFTKGDNYMVQIHRPLQEPLRSLVIASALVVDTVVRQWRGRGINQIL
jgi:hypothetical protein